MTADERAAIIGQFASALDQNTRDLAALAIRQKYQDCEDTTKRLDAYGLIGSLGYLYQYCPRGTEVGAIFILMRGERRLYKFAIALRDPYTGQIVTAPITGHILDLGIGKQVKGDGYVLSTTGYGSDIVRALADKLYGDSNALASRNI